jgi:hypothetical protein
MTDLFYAIVLAVALIVFGFTLWVTSEGYLVWQMATMALTVIAAGIVCIFYAWANDRKEHEE